MQLFLKIRWIFLGLLLLSAARPMLASGADGPQLYLPETKFDFGPVDEGQELVHYFRVHNQGKSPLKVVKQAVKNGMESDMGCSEIKPDDFCDFKVAYRTTGRPGRVKKTLLFSTNDPQHPQFKLQIQMTVIPRIRVRVIGPK